MVSHDRYFLQKIPTRILELEPDGLREYLGRYDYYLEKKAQLGSGKQYLEQMGKSAEGSSAEKTAGTSGSSVQLDAAAQRQLNKIREAEERRRKRKLEELENQISTLESEIAQMEEEMVRPENAADYQRLARLGEDVSAKKILLDGLYSQWAELDG